MPAFREPQPLNFVQWLVRTAVFVVFYGKYQNSLLLIMLVYHRYITFKSNKTEYNTKRVLSSWSVSCAQLFSIP